MATPVEMPKLGNTVEECLLSKWRKHRGDAVTAGDIVAEIETDKASFDVPAPASGTLLATFFAEGALVPVYSNICVIGEPGEDAEAFRPAAQTAPVETQRAERASSPAPEPLVRPVSAESFLSPRARRFAAQHRFHPRQIAGSGPGGRVLESDIRQAFYSEPRLSPLAARYVEEGYEPKGVGTGPDGLILSRDLEEPGVALSNVRARIARRMRESLASTAQYTLHTSADATALLAARAKVKARRSQDSSLADISIGDLVMFCAIKALLEIPALNVEFIDGKLHQRTAVNLGFACDTPRGLLVPVVHGSEKLSAAALSARVKALTSQALEGTLAPDDMTGATFTVSNLGSFGVESFTPILNAPQVAILGVDAIQLKPVRRDGGVAFIDSIGLSLTLDHQVIDGAPGARFLQALRRHIEAVGDAECTI